MHPPFSYVREEQDHNNNAEQELIRQSNSMHIPGSVNGNMNTNFKIINGVEVHNTMTVNGNIDNSSSNLKRSWSEATSTSAFNSNSTTSTINNMLQFCLSEQHQQQQQQQQKSTTNSSTNSICSTSSLCSSMSNVATGPSRMSPSVLSSSSSSSSSHFDFQPVVQPSSKRVKLSSRPSELRLQSDLQQLVTCFGWKQQLTAVQEESRLQGQTLTTTTYSPNESNQEIMNGMNSHTTDSNNYYYYIPTETSSLNDSSSKRVPQDGVNNNLITLRQVDKLLLQLIIFNDISVWIQIPPSYPNQPPSVDRINNNSNHHERNSRFIHRILIQDASFLRVSPLSNNSDDEHMEAAPDSSSFMDNPQRQQFNDDNTHAAKLKHGHVDDYDTVVYNEWSPAKRLGDLIHFIIDQLTSPHQGEEYYSQKEHSHQYFTSSSSRNRDPLNHEKENSLNHYGQNDEQNGLMKNNYHFYHQQQQNQQFKTMSTSAFTSTHKTEASPTTTKIIGCIMDPSNTFPPNRFDVGYNNNSLAANTYCHGTPATTNPHQPTLSRIPLPLTGHEQHQQQQQAYPYMNQQLQQQQQVQDQEMDLSL